jgi:hypothetical protein
MQAVLIQCLIYRGKSNIQLLIYPKLSGRKNPVDFGYRQYIIWQVMIMFVMIQ